MTNDMQVNDLPVWSWEFDSETSTGTVYVYPETPAAEELHVGDSAVFTYCGKVGGRGVIGEIKVHRTAWDSEGAK